MYEQKYFIQYKTDALLKLLYNLISCLMLLYKIKAENLRGGNSCSEKYIVHNLFRKLNDSTGGILVKNLTKCVKSIKI